MNLKDCFRYFGSPLQYQIKETEWKRGKICGINMYDESNIQITIEFEGYSNCYSLNEISGFRINDKEEKERNQKAEKIIKFTNRAIQTCRKKQFECRSTWWEEKKLQAKKQNISLDVLDTIEFLIKEENKSFEYISEEELLSLFSLLDGIGSKKDQEIIKGMIADSKNCSSTVFQICYNLWSKYAEDPSVWNDFIIIASKFDNRPLCFYLLNHFWEHFSFEEGNYLHLWWWYLDSAEKYNDFEMLRNIDITRNNIWIIYKSLIYIFYKYKNKNQVDVLVEKLRNIDSIEDDISALVDLDEAVEIIYFIRNYLPVQEEGHYLRFAHCVDKILEEIQKDGYECSKNEEMSGYIYEYVPRKEYGFIIGKDLQRYFFHRDDLKQGKEKEIREAFSMEKNPWQEPLVTADFNYRYETKRSKHAYGIY